MKLLTSLNMQTRYIILLILIAFMLNACAQNIPAKTTDTFCELYQPIYMSERDTEETKQQIDANNGVYDELCVD
ncbi:MAG: hypothetical protein CV087_22690 [Candidatus Brocadia sp. WS118]|nr:MAG: hypothetical protein CV087_22690 [Candidatus Brocadia sp. WS118]